MLTPILIASLTASGVRGDLPLSVLGRHRSLASPYVEVWTNRDDVYHRGDKVKLYFRTDVDAYVTVFRIDTDGRIRVLFPASPFEDNYAVGGESYRVDPRDDGYTFRVDDYPGEGYLFAVATLDPFVYQPLVRGDHWDYRLIGTNGRIGGDPYVAVGDLIGSIVPAHYANYTYDIVPYFVERRYEYPRFLCYDCHSYASYPYWDPYVHSCVKFRIVIYDDPYYYPARAYPRTRVVYRRPTELAPRYVFKDRAPDEQFVVTVRERPVDDDGRRRVEPGATRRVLPGGTLLPTPAPRRQTTPAAPDDPSRRSPVTPTLERRDPARAPTVIPKRRKPEGVTEPPARATEPPARGEPSRRPEAQPAPERRVEPAPEPARRAEPIRSATPSRAEPRRAEPQRTTPPRTTPSRPGSSGKKTEPPKRQN